jgi:hypothetical protein
MSPEEPSRDSGTRRGTLRRAAIVALIGAGLFFVPEGLDRLLLRPPGPGEAVTEAEVLKLRESRSSSGTSGHGDGVTFLYRVDGRVYCSGGRVVGNHEGDPAAVCANEWVRVNRATVDAYAPGDAIPVRYELDRPANAAPLQAPHRRLPWWLAGLFLIGLGALLTWVGLRGPIDFTRTGGADRN